MKNTWRFGELEFKYIREVLDSGSGSSTSGSMTNRFEKAFADKVGAKYAIAFNSGTGTLHAALEAVGVGTGDEVITTPLTVIANGDVILAQNAIPVFADIDPNTFNIDPNEIEKKITNKTKAIMPVSLYGLCCDMDSIMNIASKHNIPVINDAAEAHMAEYKGKPIGAIGDIISYSTENSKHITTGDGGIVVTDNEDYARLMRKFGSLGYAIMQSEDGRVRIIDKEVFQNPSYKRHDAFGYNYRMPEVASAMGLAQVEKMDFFVNLRTDIAEMYHDAIKDCDFLIPQNTPDGYKNTYWTFTIKYIRDDVAWQDFRKTYMGFGGDGIYAAWSLVYQETVFSSGAFKKRCPMVYEDISYPDGTCPIAEKTQPQLMQFVTNYGSLEEAKKQIEALEKTIHHYS